MHIDVITVIQGIIVISGWNDGPAPDILYDGIALSPQYHRVNRADLISIFGEKAALWGFSGSVGIGTLQVDVAKISVRLTDGVVKKIGDLASGSTAQKNLILNQFLAEVGSNPGPLLEIGSRARSGNSYRSLFPANIDYTGIDISDGPNVDIVGDAHHLSRYTDKKFKYAFSISVFEHVLMPWKAALEMNAVMTTGGLAYIQSHHGWPLHEEPWDFWRFSSNAWKGLFNAHTGFEVVNSGYDLSAMIVPHINLGGPLQNIETHPTHLLSACLVRKVTAPVVSWDAEVGDVYDLHYAHA